VLARPAACVGATAVGAIVTALLLAQLRLRPQLFERWVSMDFFPQEAVRYLNALGPPVRLLNTNVWGGYLMIHAPESRLFIDGRGNTVYPDEIAAEHAAMRSGGPDLPERIERWRFDAAILGTGSGLATNLARLPRPWLVAYQDAKAVILLPPDSPLLHAPLPTAEQVLGPGWQSSYLRVARALRDGDRAAAIRELEAVVAADPLRTSTWQHLALIHGMAGDVDAVRATIAEAIRLDPRSRVPLRLAEAEAYLKAGDEPRAIQAYRDLRWYDTGGTTGTREQLAELERKNAS
jgi:tetratricopeptide (TPR) repeat protein